MEPFDPLQRRLFTLINVATSPWWLVMIAAPRSRLAAWMAERAEVVLVSLGLGYATLLARGLGGEGVDFTDGESVRAGLARPDGFLAGWAHFVAFDLFVGRWIWRTALAEGRGCRVALLLTWFAGPLGLSWFTLQRRLRPAT